MVNNTYINERKASAGFLRVAGTPSIVRIVNNIIIGTTSVLSGPGQTTNNLVTGPAEFVDAVHYDYRLAPRSAAFGAGVGPGKADEFNLTPNAYYRHPLGRVLRPAGEKLNIGACPAGGS